MKLCYNTPKTYFPDHEAENHATLTFYQFKNRGDFIMLNVWRQVACVPAFLHVIDVKMAHVISNTKKWFSEILAQYLFFCWKTPGGSISKNGMLTGHVCFVNRALFFSMDLAKQVAQRATIAHLSPMCQGQISFKKKQQHINGPRNQRPEI